MPQASKPLPIVALVGRTNVGKSSLFNRFIEEKKALTSAKPNTTRDRLTGTTLWRGRGFTVMDTGGQDIKPTNDIEKGILEQAKAAEAMADVIVLVTDGVVGPVAADRILAKMLRQLHKPVIVAINKCERAATRTPERMAAFASLGFGDGLAISAATGTGVGDLLDHIFVELKRIKKNPPLYREDPRISFALVGKPNVGKSSLANAILEEERFIVSATPHTTREPDDIPISWQGHDLLLIDTAGLRKHSKTRDEVVRVGMEKTMATIERADVCFLVLDGAELPGIEDKKLAGMIVDAKKGCVIVVNKWDLIPNKTPQTAVKFERAIREFLPFLDFAPIIFTSATEGLRAKKLLDLAIAVQDERERFIEEADLLTFFKTAVKEHKPSRGKGPRHPYLLGLRQVGRRPPAFLLTIKGAKDTLHFSYLRFLENRIRSHFGFIGTPIEIRFEEFGM